MPAVPSNLALATGESAETCLGLATALWWLGDSHASVGHASRAYVLFREARMSRVRSGARPGWASRGNPAAGIAERLDEFWRHRAAS